MEKKLLDPKYLNQDTVMVLPRGRILKNYIVPGMISIELGPTTEGGFARILHMTREQEFWVTAHDHRYNLHCQVITGIVTNYLYELTYHVERAAATHTILKYNKTKHSLDETLPIFVKGNYKATSYGHGQIYTLVHDVFHSIWMTKGTQVLIVESAQMKDFNHCLVPYVQGKIANTFLWKHWMMEQVLDETK